MKHRMIALLEGILLSMSMLGSAHAQTVTVFDTVYTPPGYSDGSFLARMFVPAIGNGMGVILLHGSPGSRTDPALWCDTLAAYGYVAMSIDYPENLPYPEGARAAKIAVEFLRRNASRFGITTDKIIGWGMSLGSVKWGNAIPWDNDDSLFQTDPTVDDHIDAAILLYGYYQDECIPFVQTIATPVLLMHGTGDNVVPYGQSVALYDSLVAHGKLAQLLLFDGLPHAFDLNYPTPSAFTAAGLIAKDTTLSFLRRMVQPALKIRVSSSSLNCGNVLLSTSDTFAISIDNIGAADLRVDSVRNAGGDYALFELPGFPLSLGPNSSVRFNVAFHPTAAGVRRDTITLASDDTLHPVVRIALYGRGVSAIERAGAGVIYATSPEQPDGRLYAVNPSTGDANPIGPLGATEMWGLTVRPSTEELYAISPSPDGSKIYRISSDSGFAVRLSDVPLVDLRAMAFSPSDVLYGATSAGKIYRINPATGDTALVGASQGLSYSGLAFDPQGDRLWASVRAPIDSIFTIDTATGAATLVGTTGFSALTTAITFDPDGRLYALIDNGSGEDYLAVLDTTNASGTLVSGNPLSVMYLQGIAMRADSTLTGVLSDRHLPVLRWYSLDQGYPNPFNPTATIRYDIPKTSVVTLKVYDVLGQEVATLVNGVRPPGAYMVRWDASDQPSGVYFYRLQAENFTNTKRLLLVK